VRGGSPARRLLLSHRHTHQIHVDDVVRAILWFMERALARDLADAGVSIYNLSNDDIEQNTFASLLRKADAQNGGKSTINLPYLPSMLDSMVKYHNWQLRYPFGMLRYSPEKLYATGYRHKLGINEAQDLALRRGAPQ
jgi:nucleoside-diphosphate-sugar epimerase